MIILDPGVRDAVVAAGTTMRGTDTRLVPLPPPYDPFFASRSLIDVPRSMLIDRIEVCGEDMYVFMRTHEA